MGIPPTADSQTWGNSDPETRSAGQRVSILLIDPRVVSVRWNPALLMREARDLTIRCGGNAATSVIEETVRSVHVPSTGFPHAGGEPGD